MTKKIIKVDETKAIELAVASLAMLSALREFTAWCSCPPSLRGSGWQAHLVVLEAMARTAIVMAETAGIE